VTKGEDMDVNPIKGKNLTNVRKTSSDEAIYLTPAMPIDIEKGLSVSEVINKHIMKDASGGIEPYRLSLLYKFRSKVG
jgi:predicted membrane GTPase involved in stress response